LGFLFYIRSYRLKEGLDFFTVWIRSRDPLGVQIEREKKMNVKLTFDAINEIDTSKLSREELEKQILRLKVLVEKLLLEKEN